jgi:hypothetical protein
MNVAGIARPGVFPMLTFAKLEAGGVAPPGCVAAPDCVAAPGEVSLNSLHPVTRLEMMTVDNKLKAIRDADVKSFMMLSPRWPHRREGLAESVQLRGIA